MSQPSLSQPSEVLIHAFSGGAPRIAAASQESNTNLIFQNISFDQDIPSGGSQAGSMSHTSRPNTIDNIIISFKYVWVIITIICLDIYLFIVSYYYYYYYHYFYYYYYYIIIIIIILQESEVTAVILLLLLLLLLLLMIMIMIIIMIILTTLILLIIILLTLICSNRLRRRPRRARLPP